jgi:RNA polymerase sigma-32 factor
LQAIEEGDLPPETVSTIAHRLDVPEHEVVNMNRRLAGSDHSLNAPLRSDGENDAEWQDWLEDPTPNQEIEISAADELSHRRKMLDSAMSQLNERERHIFTQRRLIEDPMTLEELSQIYGISRERVRQIEARSLEKIEHLIEQENHDPAF